MIICPVCGKELMDTAKFCASCGSPVAVNIPTKKICQVCGQEIAEGAKFCGTCGTPVPQDYGFGPGSGPQKQKKPFPKKIFLFAGIGVAAVAVLAVVVILVLKLLSGAGDSKAHNYALFLKDSEVYYSEFKKDDPLQVTNRLTAGETVDNEDLYDARSELSTYFAFTNGGKRLFYPDRVGESDYGLTLFYRDINKPKAEPVKVDSDISTYSVNDEGTELFYVKGADRTLYFNNFEEKIKIASSVSYYTVSEDMKKIGYLTDDNGYYIWYRDGSSVKIASDISGIVHTDADLTEIWYTKNGTLYKLIEGDAAKITVAENVYNVATVYETGEAYFIREELREVPVYDFVTDPYAESDAAMTEPVYPSIPSAPVYPSFDQYNDAALYEEALAKFNQDYDAWIALCNQMITEYEEAYTLYAAKMERDYIRYDLQTLTVDMTRYSLYYYDGQQEHLVTADMAYSWDYDISYDKAVAMVNVKPASEIAPVSIDSIGSAYDVYDMVNNAANGTSEYYLAYGNAVTPIDIPAEAYPTLTFDGSSIYYVDTFGMDYDFGNLYTVSVADGKISTPVMVDTEVYRSYIHYTDGDMFYYYKDFNTDYETGDLYANGELVSYDTYCYTSIYDGVMYFYTDWDYYLECGTLNTYENGTKNAIAIEVADFALTDGGDLLYLSDYSFDRYYGTLYHYSDGEAERVADDVVALIDCYDYTIHGRFYW